MTDPDCRHQYLCRRFRTARPCRRARPQLAATGSPDATVSVSVQLPDLFGCLRRVARRRARPGAAPAVDVLTGEDSSEKFRHLSPSDRARHTRHPARNESGAARLLAEPIRQDSDDRRIGAQVMQLSRRRSTNSWNSPTCGTLNVVGRRDPQLHEKASRVSGLEELAGHEPPRVADPADAARRDISRSIARRDRSVTRAVVQHVRSQDHAVRSAAADRASRSAATALAGTRSAARFRARCGVACGV